MTFLDEVQKLEADLLRAKSTLSFLQRYLPQNLLETVISCQVASHNTRIKLDCSQEKNLADVLAIFRPREVPQYLVSFLGAPVTRAESLTLQVTQAATPVHPLWRRDSPVTGSTLCWVADLEEHSAFIEVTGALSAASFLFSGLAPVSDVPGLTAYALPLNLVEVSPTPPDAPHEAVLADVAKYLNQLICEEAPRRRGYAPATVLTWLAQAKFGLPLTVTERPAIGFSSALVKRYGIQLRDANGRHWHSLNAVSQAGRQGHPADQQWYDLAPLAEPLTTAVLRAPSTFKD